MSSNDLTFAETIRAIVDDVIADEHSTKVARVVSWDAARQRAIVQPLIRRGYLDEQGVRQTELHPPIPNVPICFFGLGGYRITVPVPVGSLVTLLFCDESIDAWLQRGAPALGVDPVDDRRRHISDAIAIPGLYHLGSLPTTAPSDAMVIHADALKLGSPSATARVAVDADFTTRLLDILTHASVLAGFAAAFSDGGTTLQTALETRFGLATFGSSVVKAAT